jgi:predicted site-specific integrase-resolvase
VSEVVGFDRLDRLLELRFILQCHTTKMENMELFEAMQEMMDAYQAKMLAKMEAGYEKMTARLEAELEDIKTS